MTFLSSKIPLKRSTPLQNPYKAQSVHLSFFYSREMILFPLRELFPSHSHSRDSLQQSKKANKKANKKEKKIRRSTRKKRNKAKKQKKKEKKRYKRKGRKE